MCKCIYTHTHTHRLACPDIITYIVNLVCIYVMYTHTHADLACLNINTYINTHVNSECIYVNLYTHTCELGVRICEYIHTHLDCWCEHNVNYTHNHLHLVSHVNICTPPWFCLVERDGRKALLETLHTHKPKTKKIQKQN